MRILIADDNDAVRRGVIEMLCSEPGWEICGEARNGCEAVEINRHLNPDLVLLDVSMPGMSGLEAARLIRQEAPDVRIIVLSQHDPAQLGAAVTAAGGDACVDKSCLGTDLLRAIKSVCCGV